MTVVLFDSTPVVVLGLEVECTFSVRAVGLVDGRPVVGLKAVALSPGTRYCVPLTVFTRTSPRLPSTPPDRSLSSISDPSANCSRRDFPSSPNRLASYIGSSSENPCFRRTCLISSSKTLPENLDRPKRSFTPNILVERSVLKTLFDSSRYI